MTCQSVSSPTGKPLETFDEVTEVQLDTRLASAAECFTGDPERGKRVTSVNETAMMFINNINGTDADLPASHATWACSNS